MKICRTGVALASTCLLLVTLRSAEVRADTEHTVESGDTLWGIARRYHLSVDALREANGLGDADRILAGQRLTIPGVEPAATTVAPAEVSVAPASSPAPQETVAAAEPVAAEAVPESGPAHVAAVPSRSADGTEEDELVPPTDVEDPGGQGLQAFWAALERVEGGVPGALVRVAHFGDSHSATNSFTQAIRRVLAARFGDAGPGFVQPGKPWRTYDPPDLEVGSSGVWSYDRVRRTSDGNLSDGLYGLGAFSARTAEPDAAIWLESDDDAPVSSFEVEYLLQPGGGSAELVLDGRVVARIDSTATGASAARHRVRTEEGAHRFEIRARGDGEVRLLGIEADRTGPGVVYDVLAANGARADWLLEWNEDLLTDSLSERQPDLVVLMYGTNEAGDANLDLERAARDFHRVLELLRGAAPEAACLVLAPPDMSQRTRRRFSGTPEVLPRLVEVQRSAAFERGCAFFDTFAAMGGAGAMDRWAAMDPPLAGDDRVHLTAPGYRALGQAIAEALLRGFDARETSGDTRAGHSGSSP